MSNSEFIIAMIVVAVCIVGVIAGIIFLVFRNFSKSAKKQISSYDDLPLYRTYTDVFLCHIPEVCSDLNNIDVGSPINFVREPDNQYDDTAVAVYCDNKKIGYLFKNNKLKTMIFKSLSDSSIRYDGIISSINGDKVNLCINRYENIIVYISPNGKKYHSDPLCFTHEDENCIEIELSKAIKQGYSPCSKCCK